MDKFCKERPCCKCCLFVLACCYIFICQCESNCKVNKTILFYSLADRAFKHFSTSILDIEKYYDSKEKIHKNNKDYCKSYHEKNPKKYRKNDAERKQYHRIVT